MKSFSSFHPIVLFCYYAAVFIITISRMNPILIACSLFGGVLFFTMLNPVKRVAKEIGFYVLVFLLVAVANMLFVHNGETILFFMNDNPITYEAAMYGTALASVLVAAVFWSKCYCEVVSTDKFIYLFGKAIPKLSLFLSMLLRFIPLFKQRLHKVNQAQKALGFYTSDSMVDRVAGGVQVAANTFLWTIEQTFGKPDSMKARGYGLKGRTNFAIFTFSKRDFLLLSCIAVLCLAFAVSLPAFYFYYYPRMAVLEMSSHEFLQYIYVFVLMMIPSIIEAKENIQWRLLRSRM